MKKTRVRCDGTRTVRVKPGWTAIMTAAALLAAVPRTASAAYYVWYGKSTPPAYWDDTACWGYRGSGSNPWIAVTLNNFGCNWQFNPIYVVDDGKTDATYDEGWNQTFAPGWDNIVTFRTVSGSGNIQFTTGTPEAPVIFTATDAAYGINAPGNPINIGQDGAGHLRIQSGHYIFSKVSVGMKANTAASLTLNGGILETKSIGAGSGSATIAVNGGTLKAAADSNGFIPSSVAVTFGENGGAIDAGGFTVKLGTTITRAPDAATLGTLRVKGGGSLTLSGGFAGPVAVEDGTCLITQTLPASLAVVNPPRFGGYSHAVFTLTGGGTIPDAWFAACTFEGADALTSFTRSEDGKSIIITRVPPSVRVTAFDWSAGTVTLAFTNMIIPQKLVAAWNAVSGGSELDGWPYDRRAVVAVVEAGTETATYRLPNEALGEGMFWRLFLGDEIVQYYDEEVEWVQPGQLGAYIQTAFTPSKNPKAEIRLNLDRKPVGESAMTLSDWGSILDAGTAYANSLWLYANASGRIGARRKGYADFGPFPTADDLLIELDWLYANVSKALIVNGTVCKHNNWNQSGDIIPQSPLRFWGGFVGGGNGAQYGYSAYKFYSSTWWNTGKTTVEADFIPVQKTGEYGLFDKVTRTFYTNVGAGGVSALTGGPTAAGKRPLIAFTMEQNGTDGAFLSGLLEVVASDRKTHTASLRWPMPEQPVSLWVVYSERNADAAPGPDAINTYDFAYALDLSDAEDDGDGHLFASFALIDPAENPTHIRYRSHRFVLATPGSTADTITPFLVSEMCSDIIPGLAIIVK